MPAVVIRIARGPAVQRKSSATICGNACGIDAITIRGWSPRVTSAIVVDPRREQARVVCPGLGDCEATSQSLLRKGGGRVNEKMTHNERSRCDKNFHMIPLEGRCDFARADSGENFDSHAAVSLSSVYPANWLKCERSPGRRSRPAFSLPCRSPVKITLGHRGLCRRGARLDKLNALSELAK